MEKSCHKPCEVSRGALVAGLPGALAPLFKNHRTPACRSLVSRDSHSNPRLYITRGSITCALQHLKQVSSAVTLKKFWAQNSMVWDGKLGIAIFLERDIPWTGSRGSTYTQRENPAQHRYYKRHENLLFRVRIRPYGVYSNWDGSWFPDTGVCIST